jgi:hypothetical protein
MQNKTTKLYIVLLFLIANNAIGSDTNNDIDEAYKIFKEHKESLDYLHREIDKKKLELQKQKLKTDLQRSKQQCQELGGCEAKTIYTPPANIENKNKKNPDEEIKTLINRPLPKITGIGNKTVSFDHGSRIYNIGDVVYGVWLITNITTTSVELKSKDDDSLKTLYFYWDKK